MPDVLIIGSGLAGYSVARELRKREKNLSIALITRDTGCFYSKPTLSNALALNLAPEAIPTSSADQMAARLNVAICPNCSVDAIDVENHVVHAGERAIRFSQVVLAVGADQRQLSIEGNGTSRLMRVNDLHDYERFRASISGKQRIAIIGAGLIGCEFANDLILAGYSVDVIDVAGQPLPRLLPPDNAQYFKAALARTGVNWHLGTTVRTIEALSEGLRINLADGECLMVDSALSAVGLSPRTALAHDAGIATRLGIVVNRYLETTAPGVYALGDCSEVEGLVLPYVAPISHAARAISMSLLGKRTAVTYPPMPIVVKTPACPTIITPPMLDMKGSWQVEQSEDGIKATFHDDRGHVQGFALCGSATAANAALCRQLPQLLS